MRERLILVAIIMLTTAFLGEMKMNPFGDAFRFSLGIAAFFFGILWFRTVPILTTGFLVGGFILGFRVLLDVVADDRLLFDSFRAHVPSAFYYFAFAFIIRATRLRESFEHPLWVGFIGTAADLISNLVELEVRNLMGGSYPLNRETFFILFLFAVLRSFFVVGLYNILSIRQVRALADASQRELERLMLINSELYEEALYLQKSMSHLEDITRKSYYLYKRLIEVASTDSTLALHIAEHVHEVKKDSQRILAGLSKIINQEELSPRLTIHELCGMVVRANKKYAKLLGKQIKFHSVCNVNLSTNQIYPLLSVLNNLVANSVEAIFSAGSVHLHVVLDQGEIVFQVTDSGPGISTEDQEWVFQAGYTTKYDMQGNPSTGIGLTHARDIVKSLNGTLAIRESQPDSTMFEVRIPSDQLMRGEVS